MAPGLTLNDSPPLHPSATGKLASPPSSTLSPPPSPDSSPNTSTSETATTKHHITRPDNAFEDLVKHITTILGPTSGLTTEGVDVDALTRLMEEYVSREEEWGRYALGDFSRGYTRNLVDVGNGKSNLVCPFCPLLFSIHPASTPLNSQLTSRSSSSSGPPPKAP